MQLLRASLLIQGALAALVVSPRHPGHVPSASRAMSPQDKQNFLDDFKQDFKNKIEEDGREERIENQTHIIAALKKRVSDLEAQANETASLQAALKNATMRAAAAEKQAASFRAQAETEEVVEAAEEHLLKAAEANMTHLAHASHHTMPAADAGELQQKLLESQKKLAERTNLLARQAAELAEVSAAKQSLEQRVRKLTEELQAAQKSEADEKDSLALNYREVVELKQDERDTVVQLQAARREIQELRQNLTRAEDAHWWSR